MTSVLAPVHRCEDCGRVSRRSHHDHPTCDGLVVVVDGDHQCSRCGARMRPATACGDCGGELTVDERRVPVDFSPTVSRRDLERTIHDATNRARRDHDVDPIPYDPHLATVARSHSCHMVDLDFSGHETPSGTTLTDRYDRDGYDWRRCGENVAKHYPDDLDDATDGAVLATQNFA